MEGIEHRTVAVNGINMHVALKGPNTGPVILFIHGFPDLWSSWLHQINSLAALGYRAVAPDMRGYGDTDAPADITSYTCLHVVGDLIALLDSVAPDEEKVFVVGHDWGAVMAWYLCLFRPDRVKALVNISDSYGLYDPSKKPVEIWRAYYGDDYYMCRFQIEAELAHIDMETIVKKLFVSFSSPNPCYMPKKNYKDFLLSPANLPSWFSEEEFKYYVTQFNKTGFTGGINYYRNFDRNWELTAPWNGAKVLVPAKFIVGDQDIVYNMVGIKEYIHGGGFKKDVPLLEEVVILEGADHYVHRERAEEVNQLIYEFINKF